MKKTHAPTWLAGLAALLLMLGMASCKKKIKDADIQTAVQTALSANAGLSGVSAAVQDGVVTITGEAKDEAAKAAIEGLVKGIEGVKSVVNSTSVAPPPVIISPDAALMKSVSDALASYSGVTADVVDGVVTLSGNLKKSDLPKLMQALNALQPKKIENKLTLK